MMKFNTKITFGNMLNFDCSIVFTAYLHFLKYAKLTPYYEEILKIKNSYTDEDNNKDSKWMDLMIKRASLLVNETNTLKNVFESGKETRL